MFCDQDDVWREDKIEITLNKMLEIEKDNTGEPILIHTDLKVVDEELNVISKSMFKYQRLDLTNQYKVEKIALENIVTGCTMMLNKHLVKISKDIPKEAIMHDWWIAIITLKHNGVIEFVNKATILYRQHSVNSIGAKKVNLLYYAKKAINLKDILGSYKSIYLQYININIDISISNFILHKLLMIINKIIK